MKKNLLSLVAMMFATAILAQNTLVATLSHGDRISMYYGTYALRDALNAASGGDVINLSGGAFQAVNITKGVTLRGSGIDSSTPTYISGDFTINIPTSSTYRLTMEGIRCSNKTRLEGKYNNPYFIKCEFTDLYYGASKNSSVINNGLLVNCLILNNCEMEIAGTAQFINCFVKNFQNNRYAGSNTSGAFVNCVIVLYNEGSYQAYYTHADYINNFQLLNTILCRVAGPYSSQLKPLPASSIATNCISVDYQYPSAAIFSNQTASTNNKTATYTELFKNFTDTYSEGQLFELTANAKKNFLGNDGTEVGMHGGLLPYNTTPSYPQVTKMNVANKTTADGKLSVEIEVSAVE